MNNFHEQAMSFVYQQVLHRLLGFFSRSERIALQLLTQRLLVAAGGIEQIGRYRVQVVHEGGKECAYTLAFLRAAQLSIAGRSPDTFVLRVAVLRQPRVTRKVMERIQAQCAELFIFDDRRVELLLIDDRGVRRQHKQSAFENRLSVMDRTQVLMSGHLTQGDARATFFYADLLSRAKLYRYACEWGGKVDALIDRRPPTYLDEYTTWIRRVAKQRGHALNGEHRESFETAVKLCSRLDDDYKQLLRLSPSSLQAPSTVYSSNEISVINIFDCLTSEVDLLNSQVLMFFEGAWDITSWDIEEPQAAALLLVAHLQGLRGVYRHGLEYNVGADAYLRRISIKSQGGTHFKGLLIKQLLGTFNTPRRIDKLRGLAAQYLDQLHGVSDEQMGCFICSPFVNKGRRLEAFLQNFYPEKSHSINNLRQVLTEQGTDLQTEDVTWLESVSGLSLSSLQALYHMPKIDFEHCNSLIASLRAYDPGKQAVPAA